MIDIIEVRNGFLVSRTSEPAMTNFTVFVETWEHAQDLVIKILEHEMRIMKR